MRPTKAAKQKRMDESPVLQLHTDSPVSCCQRRKRSAFHLTVFGPLSSLPRGIQTKKKKPAKRDVELGWTPGDEGRVLAFFG